MPRMDVDLMTLPLDTQQGFLLSRLDGMTDVPTLASLTGMTEDQVTTLLTRMVTMGAVTPASGPVVDAEPLLPEAQPAPENEPEPESDLATSAQEITQRQLFETRLHAQPEDMRVAQARVAEEPELSAYCFDPVPKVIAAVLENPRTGGLQARLNPTHPRPSAGLEAPAPPLAVIPPARGSAAPRPDAPVKTMSRAVKSWWQSGFKGGGDARRCREGTEQFDRTNKTNGHFGL